MVRTEHKLTSASFLSSLVNLCTWLWAKQVGLSLRATPSLDGGPVRSILDWCQKGELLSSGTKIHNDTQEDNRGKAEIKGPETTHSHDGRSPQRKCKEHV